MLKCWNHSTATRNHAIIYCQTLEEIPLHLRLIKLKNDENFQKAWEKNCENQYKFACFVFLASGCSSVASQVQDRQVGAGVAALGADGGNSAVGWGWGNNGGGGGQTVGVS